VVSFAVCTTNLHVMQHALCIGVYLELSSQSCCELHVREPDLGVGGVIVLVFLLAL